MSAKFISHQKLKVCTQYVQICQGRCFRTLQWKLVNKPSSLSLLGCLECTHTFFVGGDSSAKNCWWGVGVCNSLRHFEPNLPDFSCAQPSAVGPSDPPAPCWSPCLQLETSLFLGSRRSRHLICFPASRGLMSLISHLSCSCFLDLWIYTFKIFFSKVLRKFLEEDKVFNCHVSLLFS